MGRVLSKMEIPPDDGLGPEEENDARAQSESETEKSNQHNCNELPASPSPKVEKRVLMNRQCMPQMSKEEESHYQGPRLAWENKSLENNTAEDDGSEFDCQGQVDGKVSETDESKEIESSSKPSRTTQSTWGAFVDFVTRRRGKIRDAPRRDDEARTTTSPESQTESNTNTKTRKSRNIFARLRSKLKRKRKTPEVEEKYECNCKLHGNEKEEIPILINIHKYKKKPFYRPFMPSLIYLPELPSIFHCFLNVDIRVPVVRVEEEVMPLNDQLRRHLLIHNALVSAEANGVNIAVLRKRIRSVQARLTPTDTTGMLQCTMTEVYAASLLRKGSGPVARIKRSVHARHIEIDAKYHAIHVMGTDFCLGLQVSEETGEMLGFYNWFDTTRDDSIKFSRESLVSFVTTD